MLLVNWTNIGYQAISTKGGKHGFFILAGYWFHHPWILCSYSNQAGDERAYRKNPSLDNRRNWALGDCEYLACSVGDWKALHFVDFFS